MKELLPEAPLQLAMPERILCSSMKEFLAAVNRYNGVKPKLYFSLYNCSELGEFRNFAQINKISFDLDSPNCIMSAKRLAVWCQEKGYRFCIIFSTKGLWIHIKTKNYNQLKNPKNALKEAQKFIAADASLTIGNEKECDIDHHIIGDIARVARMPGTFDISRRLYAQSVKIEDLTTLEHLKELGKTQRQGIFWYEKDAFDISLYDCKSNFEYINVPNYEYNDNLEQDEVLKRVPPCILKVLKNPEYGNWKARWLYTLWMKENGFDAQTTDEIAKKYFSQALRTDELKNNYNHYKKVKVVELVYGNDDLFFPRCENLFREGICDGRCNNFNKIYK